MSSKLTTTETGLSILTLRNMAKEPLCLVRCKGGRIARVQTLESEDTLFRLFNEDIGGYLTSHWPEEMETEGMKDFLKTLPK